MQYFFHVTVDGLRSEDLEGQEFDTFADAQADAIANGRTIIVDLIQQGRFLSERDAIEIADAEGRVLARLHLDQLVTHAASRQARIAAAVREVADSLLSACLEMSDTARGNVQIMDWHSGQLTIHAQQGFDAEFLDYFAAVRKHDTSACAAALRAQKPQIYSDVAAEPSLEACAGVLARAGVKAVQSTPLMSSHGLLVGVVSTHFSHPAQPSDIQMQAMADAGRKAADTILKLRAEL